MTLIKDEAMRFLNFLVWSRKHKLHSHRCSRSRVAVNPPPPPPLLTMYIFFRAKEHIKYKRNDNILKGKSMYCEVCLIKR